MDNMPAWLQLIIGLGSPLAVYVAIRVDLAVLKVKAEHNEKRADAAHELAADAHDRLNRQLARRKDDTL